MDRFFVSLTEMIQYITQSVLRSNVFIAVFSVSSTTLSNVIKPDVSKKLLEVIRTFLACVVNFFGFTGICKVQSNRTVSFSVFQFFELHLCFSSVSLAKVF